MTKKEHKEKKHHKESEHSETKPDKFKDISPEAREYLDQLLRTKADFENYRKRTEKEKPGLIEWGKSQTYLKFLPLYDVVSHAKEHLKETLKNDKEVCDVKLGEISKGLNMIFEEFAKLFKSEGITVMECMDKDYNPMHHEVLTVLEGDEKTDGKVVQEIQKGFMFGNSVLRPAKVCIGKKKDLKTEEDKQEPKK